MKAQQRPLHGVVLIDKAVGPSSHGVLGRARRLWRANKGGHTGTLDPLASGLLPLCFGAATKFAQVCLDADKGYRATLHLGQTRVGGDREGGLLLERPVDVSRLAIDAAVSRFIGAIEQTPPMQSALKHNGKPLYELARAGLDVERKARPVTIHSITVISWASPMLVIDVACTKGTYIRVLAQDLGEALGCGAHLAALRRTRTGAFSIDDSITLDAADLMDEAARDARVLSVDTLVAAWPSIDLDADNAGRFLTGLRRRVVHADVPNIRVYGPTVGADDPTGVTSSGGHRAFLGAGSVVAGELIAKRLLSPVEVQDAARLNLANSTQLIELH